MKISIKTIAKRLPLMAAILGAGLAMASITPYRNSKTSSYFYEFMGNPSSQSEVQDRTKYQRIDASCSESEGTLCGIFLAHDAAPNGNPSASDFTPQESDLWTSAQSGSSTDASIIKMKD